MQNLTPTESTGKAYAVDLSSSDRRLLLVCTMRLYLRRLQQGRSVTTRDLANLALYGDEASEVRALRKVA